MQVWNVLHAARWKYRTQKWCKKSPSAHHRTTMLVCIFVTKAYINNRKKWLNSSMSSTCLNNMANFGPLTVEICWQVWGTPANFNGFASCLRYCSDVAHRRPTKLCTLFGRLLGWYRLYIFGGSCPWQNFARCKIQFTSKSSVRLYWQRYTGNWQLHGTPAAGISQTLRRRRRNGITELSQRAPPIFGRAASRWASAHVLVLVFTSLLFLFFSGLVRQNWLYSSAFGCTYRIVSYRNVGCTVHRVSEMIEGRGTWDVTL